MREYLADDHRILNAGDYFDSATAVGAGFNVDIEHPLQSLSLGHRCPALSGRPLMAVGLAYCGATPSRSAQNLTNGDAQMSLPDPLPTLCAALGTSVLQQERSFTLWYETPSDPVNLVKFSLRLRL